MRVPIIAPAVIPAVLPRESGVPCPLSVELVSVPFATVVYDTLLDLVLDVSSADDFVVVAMAVSLEILVGASVPEPGWCVDEVRDPGTPWPVLEECEPSEMVGHGRED